MNDRAPILAALRASLAQGALADPQKQARSPLGPPAVDACLHGGLRRGVLHEVFAEGGHEAAATGFAAALAARMALTQCRSGPFPGPRQIFSARRVPLDPGDKPRDDVRVYGHAPPARGDDLRKPVLWIRQDFAAAEWGELSALGLLELGLDPNGFFLLRAPDAPGVLRAGHDALACAGLGAVVMEIPGVAKSLDLVASQRLMLAAAAKGVPAFLVRFGATPGASVAETRWRIRAARSAAKGEPWGHPAFEVALMRNRQGRGGRWVLQWSCDDGLFRERAAPAGAVVSPSSHRSPAAQRIDAVA